MNIFYAIIFIAVTSTGRPDLTEASIIAMQTLTDDLEVCQGMIPAAEEFVKNDEYLKDGYRVGCAAFPMGASESQ